MSYTLVLVCIKFNAYWTNLCLSYSSWSSGWRASPQSIFTSGFRGPVLSCRPDRPGDIHIVVNWYPLAEFLETESSNWGAVPPLPVLGRWLYTSTLHASIQSRQGYDLCIGSQNVIGSVPGFLTQHYRRQPKSYVPTVYTRCVSGDHSYQGEKSGVWARC